MEKSQYGRPKIPIDSDKLDIMLSYGATCLECAEQFHCSEDTIVRFVKEMHGITFADYAFKKQGSVRLRLRQKQINMALEGSIPMLIWLGKQMLGQSEDAKQEQDLQSLKERWTAPLIEISVKGQDGKEIERLREQWLDQKSLPAPETPQPVVLPAEAKETDLDDLIEADSDDRA